MDDTERIALVIAAVIAPPMWLVGVAFSLSDESATRRHWLYSPVMVLFGCAIAYVVAFEAAR